MRTSSYVLRVTLGVATVVLVVGAHRRASADAVSRLTEHLREGSTPRVRLQAAIGLGRYHERRSVSALLGAVTSDPDMLVRGVAAEALGRIGNPRALPTLQAAEAQEVKRLEERGGSSSPLLERLRRAIGLMARHAKPPRWAIGVGKIENRAGRGGKQLVRSFRQALRHELGEIPEVVMASDVGKMYAARLRRLPLTPYRIVGAIKSLSSRKGAGKLTLTCSVELVMEEFKEPHRRVAAYSGETRVELPSSRVAGMPVQLLDSELVGQAAAAARTKLMEPLLGEGA